MAYVAVSGGQEAIEESIRLLHCMRGSTFKELEVEAIEKKLGLLVDRVMSESGLYAPAYAALALLLIGVMVLAWTQRNKIAKKS